MARAGSVLLDAKTGLREFVGYEGDEQVRLRYTLRRSQRARHMAIAVTRQGEVIARALQWTPIYMVDEMIQSRLGWIAKQRSKLALRQANLAEAESVMACDPTDGGYVPFLGRRTAIRLGAVKMHYDEATNEIHLPLPRDAEEQNVRATLKRFMCQEAVSRFTEHLNALRPQLRALPTRWQLSGAKTRWGVCTSTGHIRVSWRLMFFAPELARYVLAHELAHLVHHNHSPAFWQETERLDPEMRAHRQALKRWSMSELPELG